MVNNTIIESRRKSSINFIFIKIDFVNFIWQKCLMYSRTLQESIPQDLIRDKSVWQGSIICQMVPEYESNKGG